MIVFASGVFVNICPCSEAHAFSCKDIRHDARNELKFDASGQSPTVSNETITSNNHIFARASSLSSRTELCVCFLACCLTCAVGVTRAHQFSRLRAVWSGGRKERRVVSKQQDGCQVTDTRSWEQKGCVWCFLGGERQIELPVKPLTEIRLWAMWLWTHLWDQVQNVNGRRVGIISSRWFWQNQRRCSRLHQSRALIAQREKQIMSSAYSLPWCSALIWPDTHTISHVQLSLTSLQLVMLKKFLLPADFQLKAWTVLHSKCFLWILLYYFSCSVSI